MKKAVLSTFICLLALSFGSDAYSKARIKKLEYKKLNNSTGLVKIKYSGRLDETPEVSFRNNHVQLSFDNTEVWPKIEKRVSLNNGAGDATLMAYQFNRETVRVRTLLPYSIMSHQKDTSITLNNGSIDLRIPLKKVAALTKKTTAKTKKAKDQYDEKYLEYLLADKKTADVKVKEPLNAKGFLADDNTTKTDKVTTALSGVEKKKSNNDKLSLAKYAGKFIVLLGVVLLLFYGVITLMKKGIFSKGKLGFLNNSQLVSVLNTTYLGPKRSLMIVKVHKQVFLVSNTEAGIQFLSEIDDVTGLVKDGEKVITGTNFDSALGSIDEKEILEKVTLKENILESSNSNSKDKVKFSDEIKKKVKNLKSLQQ